MRRYRQITLSLAAYLAAAALAASTSAFAIDRAGERDMLLQQGRILDLQTLEARQRRQAFQERQQRFREQDQMMNGQPQPRLEIPRMGRNCQVQSFGNSFLKTCL